MLILSLSLKRMRHIQETLYELSTFIYILRNTHTHKMCVQQQLKRGQDFEKERDREIKRVKAISRQCWGEKKREGKI